MPFGSINISTAGANNANMSTFMAGLTDMQRTELSGRCNFINDPSNASRYMQNAKDFCRTYQTASLSGTSGAGSTTPGATGSSGSGSASGSTGSGASGSTGSGTTGGAAGAR